MTAIIAHRDGWIASDTRVTFGGFGLGPFDVHKVIRGGGHSLVGVCGSGAMMVKVAKVLEGVCQQEVIPTLHQLLASADQNNGMLVVDISGNLTKLDDKGGVYPLLPSQEYWCAGSGVDFCLGYLAAYKAQGRQVTSEVAVQAIKAFSLVDNSVNDVVEVTKL